MMTVTMMMKKAKKAKKVLVALPTLARLRPRLV